MPVLRMIRPSAMFAIVIAPALAVVAALPSAAVGQVATIELVPMATAGLSDTATVLPASSVHIQPGESFVVEVWSQTNDSRGLSSASMSIQFDPAIAVITGVTHTLTFSSLLSGTVDNGAGLIASLSGSHLSSCADQVAVAPTWARVAILDMQAAGVGLLVVQSADTGLPGFGTAVCGLGDLPPSQVTYGSATVTVSSTPIPTVSQWGVMALALMLLSAGTFMIKRRSLLEGRP